ncbi:MAG: ClbS/DfsB family four-helix bundle protein [Acidimicrobiales bacterium]
MPAATTKQELQAVTQKEYGKLVRLFEKVDDDTAMSKEDDTSIKDIVAHRAHWIDLFIGWYNDGLAGKEVFFPAEGYKWSDLKRYNADLRATQNDFDWQSAVALLETANRRLVSFIEAHSNDDLYGGPMAGANNNWTPGRWAEAAGPSHYRSAAKYVRARLKA